jgi:hypothetical protein
MVVLDYVLTLSGNQGDYTFYADTTYHVSGPTTISGAAKFEGGAAVVIGREIALG